MRGKKYAMQAIVRLLKIADGVGGGSDAAPRLMHYVSTRAPETVWKTCTGSERLRGEQKPLDLLVKLIKDYTQPDDLVVDTFAGTLSTGIAAMLCGRRAFCSDSSAEAVTKGAANWVTRHVGTPFEACDPHSGVHEEGRPCVSPADLEVANNARQVGDYSADAIGNKCYVSTSNLPGEFVSMLRR